MSSDGDLDTPEQLAQQVILRVSRILSRDLPYEEACQAMLRSICELLRWHTAAFWRVAENSGLLVCVTSYASEPCPNFTEVTKAISLSFGSGLPGQVWEKNCPIWMEDVVMEANFPRAEHARKDGLHAAFGFPIVVAGKFVGVLEFFSKEIAKPDNELLDAFAVVGAELGHFFERRRVELELAQQASLNSYAADIGTAVNSVESLDVIVQKCAELTLRELDILLCHIWLHKNHNSFELSAVAAAAEMSSLTRHDHERLDRSIVAVVSEKSTAHIDGVLVAHIDQQGMCAPCLTACAAFPLMMNNEVLGVISVLGVNRLEKLTVEVLSRVANNLALCIARKTSEEKLLISEGRFREFANVVDETFFVSAPRLTEHYYVSPAFEKMWGIPVEKVFAEPDVWARNIIPEHRQRVAEYVRMLDGDTMPDESEIDYAITNADGSVSWLSARCFRIYQADGTWHICGTVRDITARKEAEQRISEFYSVVSHELRTPITSIKGSLLLMERGKAGDLTPRAEKLTLIARQECDRLIRLVNDMLDIKTIEVGKLQLFPEQLNPADLVGRVLESMTHYAADSKVTLRSDIVTTDTILADKDRVLQVLTNLLSNALKYSPADGEIVVRVERLGQKARFSVQDQGPGIAKQNQDKLFHIFQQLNPAPGANKGGTGLGLAICKGIVEQHGGRVGVISEQGAGATFWFELPIDDEVIAR